MVFFSSDTCAGEIPSFMQVAKTRADLQNILQELRKKKAIRPDRPASTGFVPTMGALHEGHLSLVRRCRAENPICVVSIFVNPTQFDDPEDLKHYPRTPQQDLELLQKEEVDVVFMPAVEEMYPRGFEDEDAHYTFGGLENVLEGAHRPGHFRGVAQVVAKLLRAVQPDVLYLGEKDYQQYLILRKLVHEHLKMPIRVVLCPTVREPDGLAMSSRNVRLSPAERKTAVRLYQALQHIQKGYRENRPLPQVLQEARALLEQAPEILQVDYLVVADAENLHELKDWGDAEHAYALGAIRMKTVRLIDNLRLY